MTAQKPRTKITQQDVARLAGVSVAAVSLVLGGKGRISPEGVERIYQAIDQLGYRLPATPSVAPFTRTGILLSPDCAFAAGLLPELSCALQQTGFTLIPGYADTSTLLAQDVRGIFVCGKLLNAQPDTLKALHARATARHVALTGVGTHFHTGPLATIHPDNALAAHMATDALLQQQHLNIGYLGGENHSLVRAERLGGLSLALGKAGLAFSASLRFINSEPCLLTVFPPAPML
jgi:LacI family transcriptional regulator of maltose regulon